ncbi:MULTISPECIES: ABC transporter permease subunit [Protofrankia]|uniref:ABC-type transporter, integral membrane subunit n=1 Tax=Candidatus Protofrankia datiscae TaxID=2716812 RepID=F8B3J8_9ACTN|nr:MULTISPECIES: ABC transporter permease subunit [Protofrankia]AEH07835.1 ABC-type transporter, integral membrane subunit [Candidatus Protofrankia datiscae]
MTTQTLPAGRDTARAAGQDGGADASDNTPAVPDVPPGRGAPALTTVTASAARRRGVPRWVRRPVGPLLLLLLWQIASWRGSTSTELLASPWTVVTTFTDLVGSGELPTAIAVSLRRAGAGVLLGGSVGILLALLAGLSRLGEDLIDASVQMIRTVPFVGLIPLFIIWFGIGETPKIALVAFGVAFPLYINTYAGIRNVDSNLVEAARTVGLTRLGLIRHVILPGALPNVLVGLRFSLAISWLALIFAEQINANQGLGQLMNDAQEFQRTDIIVVCLVVYAFLGLTVDAIVRLLERGLLSWRPAFSGT